MNRVDDIAPLRSAAIERIACINPSAYARTRNHIHGAVTGLSPYITHGIVTLPEVLEELLKREPLPVDHKLVYEFGWREFFRHTWSHAGDRILQSLHAGPLPDEAYQSCLPDDIRQGCTGVPVIDQAVRSLYATGTLHNHARMWLASYVVHIRRVHWRAGADWLLGHLLDGDLASNHLSWQWVAGTASHKPYLFNAANVARYAPANWHSPGSPIDRSYEALDRIALGASIPAVAQSISNGVNQIGSNGAAAPPLLAAPPLNLPIQSVDQAAIHRLKGRAVWLVHPWALRVPPNDLPEDAVIVGVYPKEFHQAWAWSEARWRWVDRAMAAVAQERWLVDKTSLAAALHGAASVRSVDDPHIRNWLQGLAAFDPAPTLFPPVARPCQSFSQWWKSATRGLHQAEELL